jgi:type III secretory pathway component EscV
MLLREGVPVTDRDRIVSSFVLGEARGQFAGPLAALRRIRSDLGAELLGAGPSRPQLLPPDLEDRIRAGFRTSDGERWEVSRPEAARLVSDLRHWIHGSDPSREVVVVADPLVRPFVWRLLAADRPAVRVLSAEEIRG